jgi:hypothetical protein
MIFMNEDSPQLAEITEKPKGLPCIHPNKKIRDEDWVGIRHMAEQGMSYEELAGQFGVQPCTIGKRASKERWLTPTRIARAKNGNVAEDDPALAIADIWKRRGVETRDEVYQGARKALSRFFAMSPVPQSFAEAATAHKMLKEAIDPTGLQNAPSNFNIQVLASSDFSPSRVVDV